MPGSLHLQQLEAFVGQWSFARAAPDPDLAGTVVEYWEVQGDLAPFREKVIPNGCVEVMIDLGPPHLLIRDGVASSWEGAWFSGLHRHAIEIQSEYGTHLVSARITPVGAFRLFGMAAPQAANQVIDLEAFAGAVATTLRHDLLEAATPADRFQRLEAFLRVLDHGRARCSPSVVTAVDMIERTHGTIKVSTLHQALSVSRKHLTVTFTREIGIPPKGYAQLRRFIWTLERIRETDMVDWSRLAIEAGYSDQSHLVRDFRRVAGASPTEYLRKRTPDNTALLEEAR